MRTLIELYDERPIENVLATEMFHPEETIFICTPEVASDKLLHASLKEYFLHRGCKVKLTFVPVSLLDAQKVAASIQKVLSSHEDCCLDISGGTDAALFAAGLVCQDVPVITYSRKRNTFFEIHHAPFARSLPCSVTLDAASCFLMAGGSLMPGREDNKALPGRLEEIDRLFSVYSTYRKTWNKQISLLQRLNQSSKDPLECSAPLSGSTESGLKDLDFGLLRVLHDQSLISDLKLTSDHVSFHFPDETVRFWLRDMGSVLELHVYRACLEAGCFDDVILSAVVNWSGREKRDAVTNEIDVMAVRGVQPVFISCKTCEIHTEALNELAILRDRFGGAGSRALIVTSAQASRARPVMRRRAAELGIELVEWSDLKFEQLTERLRSHTV